MTAETASQIPYGVELSAPSSYTARTPEVMAMLKTVQDRNSSVFWYELLQGALDYNNWSVGLPSIICVDNNGEPVNFFDYLKDPTPGIQKVEVRNWIRMGEANHPAGLTPDHVATIAHLGGEGTLGLHGRGLSIASTAALVAELAGNLSYESADRFGHWKGKAALTRQRLDSVDETLVLNYQRISREIAAETSISVENPSEDLLETLRILPRNFLPVNPQYQYALLEGGEQVTKFSNIFTVFANGGAAEGERIAFFSDDECRQKFGLRNLAEIIPTQRPRAEILPDDLVGREGLTTRTAYCGGLKVYTYHDCALNWSFYGFDNARHPYMVARGRDSVAMDGDPDSLMAEVLRRCDHPEVFTRIFETVSQQTCAEGNIPRKVFTDFPEEVQAAIAQGWKVFCESRGLDSDRNVLITSSEMMAERVQEEGFNVVKINSGAFTDVLISLGLAQSAEEVIGAKEQAETANRVVIHPPLNDARIGEIPYRLRDDLISGRVLLHLNEQTGNIALVFKKNIPQQGDEFDPAKDCESLGYDVWSLVRDFATISVGQIPGRVVALREGKGFLYEFEYGSGRSPLYGWTDQFFRVNRQQLDTAPSEDVRVEFLPNGFAGIDPASSAVLVYRKLFQAFKEAYGDYLKSDGSLDVVKYTASKATDISLLEQRLAERKQELAELDQKRRQLGTAIERTIGILKRQASEASDYIYDRDRADEKSITRFGVLVSLKRLFSPDISLNMTRLSGPCEYFIGNILAPYSKVGFDQYHVTQDFPSHQQRGKATMTYHKPIPAGTHVLYGLVGMKPVGVYAPGGQEIQVAALPGKNMWAIHSVEPLSKGLKVYFEENNETDTSLPDEAETAQVLNINDLNEPWRNLVIVLRDDASLTDIQKTDILMLAWKNAFTYNSKFSRPYIEDRNFAPTVNAAEGNCADAARGFMALSRAVGIPSRLVSSQMARYKRVIEAEDSHAVNQNYLDGKWVLIEPQLSKGYLEGDFQSGEIPQNYLDLLGQIPKGKIIPREAAGELIKESIFLLPPAIVASTALIFLEKLAMYSIMYLTSGSSETGEQAETAAETLDKAPLITLPAIDLTPEMIGLIVLTGALPVAYFAGRKTITGQAQKLAQRLLEPSAGRLRREAAEKARAGYIQELERQLESIKMEQGEQNE